MITGGISTTSFTPSYDLYEGSHTLEVQAVDAAGNWSGSGSFAVYIDLTAPNTPKVTGISLTNNQTPTWNWTIPAGAVDMRYRLDGGAWVITGGTSSKSFTPSSNLSEGSHILEVQAKDNIGNWSGSGSFTIIIDLTAPDAPNVIGTSPTNDKTPTWNWTIPAGAVDMRYRLDGGSWVVTGGISIKSFTPSSNLSEGSHILEVQAKDNTGNWSGSGSFTVIIDLTAPDAPNVTGNSPTNNRTPTWNWTIPTGTTNIRYRLNGGSWVITGGTGITSFTPSSNLSEKSHILDVQAQDSTGNWSGSGNFTIIIDLTAPNAPNVTGTSPTNNQTPTWNWTIPAGAVDMRYRLDGGSWVIAGGTGITSFTPSSNLFEGSHNLEVQAVDAAGNWSVSGSFVTTVDITPPAIPVLSGDAVTSDSTPTWTWSYVSNTANNRCRVDSGDWKVIPSYVRTFTPEYSLTDGYHLFEVQISDYAGNWSESGTFATFVDSIISYSPVVSGKTPTNNVSVNTNLNFPLFTDVIFPVFYQSQRLCF